jgi:Arc/MetJ family transcription regulator
MRTHLDLNDESLAQVLALGGFASRTEAVNVALSEYASLLKRRQLLALRGQVPWEGNLEALRAARTDNPG